MTTPLINQIEKHLREKGLSVHALEKMAGLNIHAVRNILSGRSKKPSAELISAIANALQCSTDDLLGKKDNLDFSNAKFSSFCSDSQINSIQNSKILLEILNFIFKNNLEKVSNISFYDVFSCVEEIYIYSTHKNKGVFSKSFAQQAIEKLIDQKNK